MNEFDSALDPGIREYVLALRARGIETVESCEGGDGHSFPEPTVVLSGHGAHGFMAFAVAREYGLPVRALRRAWRIADGEPTGPHWELTFWKP